MIFINFVPTFEESEEYIRSGVFFFRPTFKDFFLEVSILRFTNVPTSVHAHYEAKLCFLCIVSGFRYKDAPLVLLLFCTFLRSFRQNV